MPTSREEFEQVLPRLIDDISESCRGYKLPQDALEWFQKSLDYNCLGGKYNRGIAVIDSVSQLEQRPLPTDSDDFFEVASLGWMIELLQAFFLVSDDMMDASQTRRGQPCWYKAVGMVAINDAFLLEGGIYVLLKKHFQKHPSYAAFLEVFHEVTFQTELGQMCDLITAPEDDVDLDNFSMDKYRFIVVYKTAYYSFYLPVALALHWCQLATPQNLKQAHDILIPMGEFFQVQDDFLDVYAPPETLGKVGTDIQDNKCSWIINQALERATSEQRAILDANYGRKDANCEAEVRRVFAEMRLDNVYKEYETKQVQHIQEMIAKVDESEGLKREVFHIFLGKIAGREK